MVRLPSAYPLVLTAGIVLLPAGEAAASPEEPVAHATIQQQELGQAALIQAIEAEPFDDCAASTELGRCSLAAMDVSVGEADPSLNMSLPTTQDVVNNLYYLYLMGGGTVVVGALEAASKLHRRRKGRQRDVYEYRRFAAEVDSSLDGAEAFFGRFKEDDVAAYRSQRQAVESIVGRIRETVEAHNDASGVEKWWPGKEARASEKAVVSALYDGANSRVDELEDLTRQSRDDVENIVRLRVEADSHVTLVQNVLDTVIPSLQSAGWELGTAIHDLQAAVKSVEYAHQQQDEQGWFVTPAATYRRAVETFRLADRIAGASELHAGLEAKLEGYTAAVIDCTSAATQSRQVYERLKTAYNRTTLRDLSVPSEEAIERLTKMQTALANHLAKRSLKNTEQAEDQDRVLAGAIEELNRCASQIEERARRLEELRTNMPGRVENLTARLGLLRKAGSLPAWGTAEGGSTTPDGETLERFERRLESIVERHRKKKPNLLRLDEDVTKLSSEVDALLPPEMLG